MKKHCVCCPKKAECAVWWHPMCFMCAANLGLALPIRNAQAFADDWVKLRKKPTRAA